MNCRATNAARVGTPRRGIRGAKWRAIAPRRASILRFLPIVALVAGPALPKVHASQTIATDSAARVEIELVNYLENTPPSGWIPVAVRVANRAPDGRTWRVTFDCDTGTGPSVLGEWTLRVPGDETREFDLFVPQPWFASTSMYAQARGTFSGPGVQNNLVSLDRVFVGGNQTGFTGMSQILATENWSRLQSELAPPSATSGTIVSPPAVSISPTFELSGSRIDPAHMPADWRTWSGFATLWLHRDDWIAMSSAQRTGMLRWIAQGGRLYVAGATAGLADLFPAGSSGGIESNTAPAPYGFGSISQAPLASEQMGASSGPRLDVRAVAAVIRSSGHDSPALSNLTNDIDPTEAEQAIGEIRPGGLVLGLLITAIAILLGPVNILLLAPARRRARLFITVPLISLSGAIALVILILLQDGTGGHGQRGVLVALLPDRPEALVLQEQCAMTGLLVSRSFPLAADATLVDYTDNPQVYRYSHPSYRTSRSSLDRFGAQASGAWFTSRSVHSQHLRVFVPTRAALTAHRTRDDGLTVVSTCPGLLRDVIVIDARGRKWWAAEVPPGRSVGLAPAGPAVTDHWVEQLHSFGVSLGAAAERTNPPMSFHASADSWDDSVPVPTLPSIRWRHDAILVTGPVREATP